MHVTILSVDFYRAFFEGGGQEEAELLVGGWRMDGGSRERKKGGSGESQLCKRHVCVCYPHYCFLQRILGGGGQEKAEFPFKMFKFLGPRVFLEISETQIEVIVILTTPQGGI